MPMNSIIPTAAIPGFVFSGEAGIGKKLEGCYSR